jgi:SAM-dependent methyltransferase
MSEGVFRDYSAHYDLLYHDKDYGAEADYVARIVRRAAPQARTVLEFGSGSGRHGRLLNARGYQVYGVERSEAMVYLARQATGAAGVAFECTQGDIRTVDVGRSFDAVLSLFHVVSYQTTNVDVLQTFASASRHLPLGGIFFFDVWHGPAVLTQRPSVRVKRVESDTLRLVRIAEPELDTNAGVVTVRYNIHAETKADGRWTTFNEEHRMRYFFATEIDLLARATGFVVERSEEFLTGRPPSEQTWGVAYLLRKSTDA